MIGFLKKISEKVFIEMLASMLSKIVLLALVLGITVLMRVNSNSAMTLPEPLSTWWSEMRAEISMEPPSLPAEPEKQDESERQAAVETAKLAESKRQVAVEAARLAESRRQAAVAVAKLAETKRQAGIEAAKLAETKRQAASLAESKRLAALQLAELKRLAEVEMQRQAEIKQRVETIKPQKHALIATASRNRRTEFNPQNNMNQSSGALGWEDVRIISNHSEKLD